MSSLSKWNFPLTIRRRGDFFNDVGFRDARRDFEMAASDLLRDFDTLWDKKDSFTSYRKLRDRHLSGSDRAIKISEEGEKYKIVMDIEGYVNEDLQVKITDPNHLTVEGKQNYSNSGRSSSRTLVRKFSLPGSANLEEVTSELSSDNVLTVNVPKKKTQEVKKEEVPSSTSTLQHLEDELKRLQESLQDVKTVDKLSTMKERFNLSEQSDSMADRFSTLNKSECSDKTDRFSNLERLFQVPICSRDSFFKDSYFEKERKNFLKSVDDMMCRRIERIDSLGDVDIFRKVRETKKDDDVQATAISEDDSLYKIVLDVHGFVKGELKVTAVSNHALMVEGCTKQESHYTDCSHSFKRHFPLPPTANINMTTCDLSSDGILTLAVPKRKGIATQGGVPSEATNQRATGRSGHDEQIVPVVMEAKQTFQSKIPETVGEHVVPIVFEGKDTSRTSDYSAQSSISCTESEQVQSKETNVKNKEHFINIQSDKENITNEQNTSTQAKSLDQSSSIQSKIVEDKVENSSIQEKTLKNINTEQNTSTKEKTFERSSTTEEKSEQSTSNQDSGINSLRNRSDKLFESLENRINDFRNGTKDSKYIPVLFRGSLYNDSIFEDTRKSFESAAEEALSRFRRRSVKDQVQETVTDMHTNQTTSSILEDSRSYKIVLDVFGYEEHELKIKIFGLDEISVEGYSDKTKEGLISKHSFHRSFKLPNSTDIQRASTALSSEGILTITIPKKNQVILKTEKVIPITSQIQKEEQKSKERKTTLVIDSSGIVQESKNQPLYPESSPTSPTCSDVSSFKDVSSVTQLESISCDQMSMGSRSRQTSTSSTIDQASTIEEVSKSSVIDEVSKSSTIDEVSKSSTIDEVSKSNTIDQTSTIDEVSKSSTIDEVSKSNTIDQTSTIDEVSKSSTIDQVSTSSATGQQVLSSELQSSSAFDKVSSLGSTDEKSSEIIKTHQVPKMRDTFRRVHDLPIVPRGHFFDDTFFMDSRNTYESFLRNSMDRFRRSPSYVDDVGFFDSLRRRKFSNCTNQIATVSDDEKSIKIILDVHGFDENSLKIGVTDTNEMIIEGKEEEKTGTNSYCRKSFTKSILLPAIADVNRATSAMSRDGILNITIPKINK